MTDVFTFFANTESYGFFVPEPSAPTPDFAAVHVPGLSSALQFFRVTVVSHLGERTEHVLVSGYFPPLPSETLADTVRRLQPVCAPAALSVVVADKTGWAKVSSFSAAAPERTAAGVAYSKASGGWDDTNPIVVEVDEVTFQVSPIFIDEKWQLAVRGMRPQRS